MHPLTLKPRKHRKRPHPLRVLVVTSSRRPPPAPAHLGAPLSPSSHRSTGPFSLLPLSPRDILAILDALSLDHPPSPAHQAVLDAFKRATWRLATEKKRGNLLGIACGSEARPLEGEEGKVLALMHKERELLILAEEYERIAAAQMRTFRRLQAKVELYKRLYEWCVEAAAKREREREEEVETLRKRLAAVMLENEAKRRGLVSGVRRSVETAGRALFTALILLVGLVDTLMCLLSNCVH
ncbi:hypothetical protein JCM10207_000252 [Rhodosporidiobolus poonsookiae]